jgi:2-polyprenyl-6-methoxyphenol hydroxylase-like FAD-dependent oxidoreductase
MTVDVLIAGGGPNGLLLACELALAGVHPVVLELLPERPTLPKANGLVGRVVQALDYRGLYELFGGGGAPAPIPYFQFGALPLDMSRLGDHELFVLPIPQRRLEELLERRADELGVEIRRGHELVALRHDGTRVTVDVRGPRERYELTARFLVGADGGHSLVRKQCGIGFPGVTDTGFVGRTGQVSIHPPVAVPGTGELDIAGVRRLRPGTFTRTETGMFGYGMFQPGLYRVAVYEWPADPVDDSTPLTVAELSAAVGRVLGGDVPMSEPAGGEPTGLRRTTDSNSRQADRYREGPVFLVGDAAHVHAGVGGPGLNLGMQDALNLAWKLAAEVHGWAPDGLLDTYHTERYPVGQRAIMQTRAQTALLSPGPKITALREVLGELLTDDRNVRRIADLMAAADVRYDTRTAGPAHPMAGRWMPDLPLSTPDGRTRVAEVLRAARPVLLLLAERPDLADLAGDWRDRVDVVAAGTAGPPADAVLIRPDGYVAWAAGPDTPAEGLREALATWFGRPRVRTAVTG